MKNIINNLITVCLISILFINIGCTKEPEIQTGVENTPVEAPPNNTQSTAKQIENFTKTVASALIDQEIRSFFKGEALKQSNGDYDFLVRDALEYTFNNGQTFLGQMERASNELNIEQFIEENPRIQVGIPILCEDWDIENYIPLVTSIIVGPEEDDEELEEVIAYDAAGNTVILSTEEEPTEPIIVISKSRW